MKALIAQLMEIGNKLHGDNKIYPERGSSQLLIAVTDASFASIRIKSHLTCV